MNNQIIICIETSNCSRLCSGTLLQIVVLKTITWLFYGHVLTLVLFGDERRHLCDWVLVIIGNLFC